ncbi:CGNR zinc finger domain-containing protein [Longimicrobium sp.]|uniref:CGNR zinc finger domain-containing protein n=1 Tax=Longimicrobium sp. TaxID=2029185 RepID=UPI002E37861F|nr:ABATE domain-containing protein [Longimicrobium sp.]HEX6041668.1 ABATE domain-containing protein [Longimicrobium sp.]
MTDDHNPLADLSVIGGWLCLDFLNTVDTHDTLLEEKLGAYADLVWWALRVGVLTEADAAPLFAAAEADPARAADVFARAMELREALYRLFMAARAGEVVDAGDLSVVNGAIERTLGQQRIVRTEDGFSWGWEDGVQLDRVLWPVVRDAADLLVSGDLRRVGKCCGTNCDWLYLDTSRNRSRRWCDMQLCGNRAKARRHYHKAKGGIR